MQKIHKYNVQIVHDKGSCWIQVYATSKKSVVDIVTKSENCPRRAIININRA